MILRSKSATIVNVLSIKLSFLWDLGMIINIIQKYIYITVKQIKTYCILDKNITNIFVIKYVI